MSLPAGILRVLLFGGVLGAAASLAALAFVEGVRWLGDFLFVDLRRRESLSPAFFYLLIFPPMLGGIVAGALIRKLPDKRPQNPADVILAAQTARHIPFKDGALTALAALAGLGSGASVGIYGPLVHLGASVGSGVARLCKAEPGLGLGCGAAAAISTAFGAPIAGIVFAHEVVLRHYSLRAFAPITVASSAGLLIADKIFQRPPLFEISVARAVFAPEFFAFVVIGLCGALVAVVFMRAILFAARIAGNLKIPNWQKPALAGLCVGVAGLFLPEILGAGAEVLRFAITPGAYSAPELGVLLAAKILATALCLGFGFAGGVFSPALLIGVLFGALFGQAAAAVFDIGNGAGLEFYAVCGMVAVTSPVIGAPLASILLVFELTRNYELATAAMVSVVFSNLVACRLFGRSLFDRQLGMRGFDLSMGRDKARLAQLGIGELMERDFVRARRDDSAEEVMRALIAKNHSEAYVADEDGNYAGMLTLNQLLSVKSGNAGELARDDSLRFDAAMSVWDAMEAMRGFVGESIPVLDARGRLLGVVHESALVAAYLRTVRELRAEENADH